MANKPILTTKTDLARELDIDPRRKVLDQLEPVAQVKLTGNKLVAVYDRAESIKQLSALLLESAKRNAE